MAILMVYLRPGKTEQYARLDWQKSDGIISREYRLPLPLQEFTLTEQAISNVNIL